MRTAKRLCGDRVDLVVDGCVLAELKAVERIAPIHRAQLLTYLRPSCARVGLSLSFHVVRMTDGVHRFDRLPD